MPASLIAQLGAQTAGAAIGTGMGLLLEKHQDKRQYDQQRKLQDLEIMGQQQMTGYNMQKQLELWKATNYKAQMEELKKAGLNPGLLYGMGGAGGASTAIAAGNVSGADAPKGGNEIATMMGIQMQRELLKAQKENIEADTEQKKAETTKTAGVDTALAEKNIQNLNQGIQNQQAQQVLTEIQGDILSIERHIKERTQNTAIRLVQRELEAATEQLHILENDAAISKETKDEKIKIIELELIGMAARNALTKAQTGKTEAEIQNMAKQIAIAWGQLTNAQDNTTIQRKLQEFQTSFGGQAAGILKTLVGLIPGTK